MNSILEAQEEFTNQFGELSLSHLCDPYLVLPNFSREQFELDEFIRTHQNPAPIVIPVVITKYPEYKLYEFGKESAAA
jgi:hypothetical protein